MEKLEASERSAPLTVLVAHKTGDLYGSDLQLLESVRAMSGAGWNVRVVMTSGGPLVPRLENEGAQVRFVPFPVLRRSDATASGLARLAAASLPAVMRLRRMIRALDADIVYVNTVNLPWWIAAARLAHVPALCHVHEAENGHSRWKMAVLNSPLTLANRIITNSQVASDVLVDAAPWLRRRTDLVYNGVPGPQVQMSPPTAHSGPMRLVTVGRLSPRKAPDVAMEATAVLRGRGHDVELELCGTSFTGYEWFDAELRDRADLEDLSGAVTFSGYVNPVWRALRRADIVLAPSLREPFGNAVIEAQLAARPVVAAAAMGHLETVSHGETGYLVKPGDPAALADAVERLLNNADLRYELASQGKLSATKRFSPQRYHEEITAQVKSCFEDHGRR